MALHRPGMAWQCLSYPHNPAKHTQAITLSLPNRRLASNITAELVRQRLHEPWRQGHSTAATTRRSSFRSSSSDPDGPCGAPWGATPINTPCLRHP